MTGAAFGLPASGATGPGADLRDRMRWVEAQILARAPEHDLVPTLDRIVAAMELLGSPMRDFAAVHVTGTNGKTSTTRMIDALLRHHGLSTGRFTSPHLHDLRERIAIGGEPIGIPAFLDAYDEVLPVAEIVDAGSAERGQPRMTYFEMLVAVAYAAFADAPVDVAVVEVGMGGSWDATNVIDAQIGVITPIALDHQHFLGDDIVAIATEKAGVIKPGSMAVVGVQDIDAVEVLLDRAEHVGARTAFEGNQFGVLARQVAVGGQMISLRGLAGDYPEIFLRLHGEHQGHNAAIAVAATEAFLADAAEPLDPAVVRAALAEVTSPGRLEVLRTSPTILVDAAHNPAGARALRSAVEESFAFTRTIGLLAVLADKDAPGILAALEPVLDEVVISASSSPRALPPARLAHLAREIFGHDRVTVVPDLPDALDTAAGLADRSGPGAGVIATGSVTTAADVRLLLGSYRDEA